MKPSMFRLMTFFISEESGYWGMHASLPLYESVIDMHGSCIVFNACFIFVEICIYLCMYQSQVIFVESHSSISTSRGKEPLRRKIH